MIDDRTPSEAEALTDVLSDDYETRLDELECEVLALEELLAAQESLVQRVSGISAQSAKLAAALEVQLRANAIATESLRRVVEVGDAQSKNIATAALGQMTAVGQESTTAQTTDPAGEA